MFSKYLLDESDWAEEWNLDYLRLSHIYIYIYTLKCIIMLMETSLMASVNYFNCSLMGDRCSGINRKGE